MKTNDKIREIRKNRQWTQQEMADKLKMTLKGYAKIERGETRFNLSRLEQIAETFEMDLAELFSYGENKNISFTNSGEILTHSQHISLSLNNKNPHEIQNLHLMLAHKDEIIAYKNEIIESQKRELALLREKLSTLQPIIDI